ncbi:MAG: hypothetical protein O3B22_11070 [Proteobacteria bacterium]|nr:hypothetical protein [Pseudomonadota bacterium]
MSLPRKYGDIGMLLLAGGLMSCATGESSDAPSLPSNPIFFVHGYCDSDQQTKDTRVRIIDAVAAHRPVLQEVMDVHQPHNLGIYIHCPTFGGDGIGQTTYLSRPQTEYVESEASFSSGTVRCYADTLSYSGEAEFTALTVYLASDGSPENVTDCVAGLLSVAPNTPPD